MGITKQNKKFAELYATEREFFGNGVQAYAEAYDKDITCRRTYQSAASCANKLLKNAEILAFISKLLEDLGLNDAHVDKQLAFLVTQNANFGAKLGAIREYNLLRNRVTRKLQITGKDEGPIILKEIKTYERKRVQPKVHRKANRRS